MTASLPIGFEALEPFVEVWAVGDAAARAALRDRASPDALRSFYMAAQPLLDPALARLDAIPLAEHDDAQRRLMRLLLAYAHVAMAIEVQGPDEPQHARLRPHMRILRAPADIDRGHIDG